MNAADWEGMLRTLLTQNTNHSARLWVAIFSATRRSQYERLQQEYAHKEALASSYEATRNNSKTSVPVPEELQKELIARAIDAIAYNASATLDGKLPEKPPAMCRFLEVQRRRTQETAGHGRAKRKVSASGIAVA